MLMNGSLPGSAEADKIAPGRMNRAAEGRQRTRKRRADNIGPARKDYFWDAEMVSAGLSGFALAAVLILAKSTP
jgi:hypothetical protein